MTGRALTALLALAAVAAVCIGQSRPAEVSTSTASASAPTSQQIHDNLHQLRRADITAPASSASADLAEAIKRVQAAQSALRPRRPLPTSLPTTRPTSMPSDLSQEALDQLAGLSGQVHLLDVADELFERDKKSTAAKVYELVLKQQPGDQDKAWALLQLACCRRQDDPRGAIDLLRQLQSECPQSTWAAVAKQQQQLLEWYLSKEVRQVLGS